MSSSALTSSTYALSMTLMRLVSLEYRCRVAYSSCEMTTVSPWSRRTLETISSVAPEAIRPVARTSTSV